MKKETRKQIISKKIVVPVVALGIVAIATLSTATMVSAQNQASGETLARRIASRFGLNHDEVESTVGEFRLEQRQMHHERMGEMLENKLEEAVEDRDITSDQMYAILAKHEELEAEFDDMYDLSPEEAREARADMHEEMEDWALEQDIDMDLFMRYGGEGYRKGGGEGMGMHRYGQ